MAQPPITFLEKKWARSVSNNSLIKAATQSTDRQAHPMLDYDTHRSITTYGRRVLLSVGRFLYWACPPVRTAIDEMARLATSSFIPQFYGEDKEWGDEVKEHLYEGDKFIDIRGWPYTRAHYLQNLVREVLIDGDQGTLLTEDDTGPKLQVWRGHRIGSRSSNPYEVKGGTYDGASIIDGVVVNDFGRPLAYGLIPDGGGFSEPFAYPSANDFLLNFLPSHSDQVRGLSVLGCSAFNWQDREEAKTFWLMAQKIAGTMAVEIANATGKPDRTKTLLTAPATEPDASGNAQSLPKQLMPPGQILYVEAGKQQGVRIIEQNQPGTSSQLFHVNIIRESLQSMGWSFDFSHDLSGPGGANMRIVVEKIESRLQELRDLLVGPACVRIDGWRVAKGIKAGRIRDNKDWYKWWHQGPAKLTADRKYDSDIDLQEVAKGFRSNGDVCRRRGFQRDEVWAEGDMEQDKKWASAKKDADKYGISIEMAYKARWENSANGVQPEPPEPAEKPKGRKDGDGDGDGVTDE